MARSSPGSAPRSTSSRWRWLGRLYVVQQGGLIRIIRTRSAVTLPDLASKIVISSERTARARISSELQRQRPVLRLRTRAGDGATIERYQRSADNTNGLTRRPPMKTLLVICTRARPTTTAAARVGRDGYWPAPATVAAELRRTTRRRCRGGSASSAARRRSERQQAPLGIPPTNPFAASTCDGAGTGTCPEIWAYGLRNPWRWTFDRVTGDLLLGDVGQGAREEVDFDPWPGTPGRNYGWRVMEGNICTPGVDPSCSPPPNYAPPIFDYLHPPGLAVSAATGIVATIPRWRGGTLRRRGRESLARPRHSASGPRSSC
jgi:hypothetical protein